MQRAVTRDWANEEWADAWGGCRATRGWWLDNPATGWQFPFVLIEKLAALRRLIRSYESCLIAYSGGVDSVFLAKVAQEVLGERALAVIADSPSLPRRELEEAMALATGMGIGLRVVQTQEFANPDYVANPVNRCYFCKHELFSLLVPMARSGGFRVIAYGENASDVGDHRPGSLAAAEFEVRAPLKEVGLTKGEVRTLSAELGLPTADKPQMACLSSRIPYGEEVTPTKLGMVERAEGLLRQAGFREVRVRHHELKAGALARIEVGSEELKRLLESAGRDTLVGEFRALGYHHVTVDLRGYRRGSLNEGEGTVSKDATLR